MSATRRRSSGVTSTREEYIAYIDKKDDLYQRIQSGETPYVSNLIDIGEDGLTMNIYARAIEQNNREAAETIGNLLASQSTDSTS